MSVALAAYCQQKQKRFKMSSHSSFFSTVFTYLFIYIFTELAYVFHF